MEKINIEKYSNFFQGIDKNDTNESISDKEMEDEENEENNEVNKIYKNTFPTKKSDQTDKEMEDEENDEVNEIQQIIPKKSRKKILDITNCSISSISKISSKSISNMTKENTITVESLTGTESINSPGAIKKGSVLRKRHLAKRQSMTNFDFMSRKKTINKIKESTRKIVVLTLKNLDKGKKILHFKNDKYELEDKDKEFLHYYDILESLGEGCSSYVKKCRCKKTEKIYAVKIFRAYDDEYVNFAKNEFNNMKIINSKYVAKVYEMFYDQDNCKIYTVMEYCEGSTILNLIKEIGILPEKIMKVIMSKILLGVIAIHEKGTVHR